MIPTVFISSTVRDLHHLRDAIRDCISDLGYHPVMSDYGEVGYLPDQTAEDSCYLAMEESRLAVLIIGKRYSEPATGNLSVTENEYLTAIRRKIPVITLIDREVMAFKRVYDANGAKSKPVSFPGMDRPNKTFEFINSVCSSAYNNGILEFGNVAEARRVIKQQLAHIFANLLARRYDPVQADIRDVLAEIKTLRRNMGHPHQSGSREYIALLKFLLDVSNQGVRDIFKALHREIDDIVPHLMKAKNWNDLMRRIKVSVEITEDDSHFKMSAPRSNEVRMISHSLPRYFLFADKVICKIAISMDGKLYLNGAAQKDLDGFVSCARAATKGAGKEW